MHWWSCLYSLTRTCDHLFVFSVTLIHLFGDHFVFSDSHKHLWSSVGIQCHIHLLLILFVFSDGLSKDKVESIFLNMKLELMKMAASPISLFVKQHFQMVAGSVRTFPLVWSCLPGEMMYTDSCGMWTLASLKLKALNCDSLLILLTNQNSVEWVV